MQAVAFGALFIGVGLLIRWQFVRSRQVLQTWAESKSYDLLEADRCWLWRGPFWLRSNQGQQVFRVLVKDGEGRTRRGHVRVGGWFRGLFSDEVSVAWDR